MQLSEDDEAPIAFADFEEFFMQSCRERLASAEATPAQRSSGEAFMQEIGSLLVLVRKVKVRRVFPPVFLSSHSLLE